MIVVSDKDLNDNCKYLGNFYYLKDLQLFTLFTLLYSTGVRIQEALHPELWFLDSENRVGLNGLKGANVRFFQLSNLPYEFQRYFTENYNIFEYISYTNAVRYLNRALKYKFYYASGKAINFHIFRHAYIRRLYAQTNSIDVVLNDLGKTRNSDITTYLLTKIYKK